MKSATSQATISQPQFTFCMRIQTVGQIPNADHTLSLTRMSSMPSVNPLSLRKVVKRRPRHVSSWPATSPPYSWWQNTASQTLYTLPPPQLESNINVHTATSTATVKHQCTHCHLPTVQLVAKHSHSQTSVYRLPSHAIQLA